MNEPRFTPGRCANCDSPEVTEKSPLFCGPLCQQMADTIRYVRRCLKDGRWQRPDVREAIQMRIGHVLAGGYAKKSRHVRGELRAEVFRRAGGCCEQCGRPLDFDRTTGDLGAVPTIQHVAGDSNELSNLKAFCMRCNLADAQTHLVPVEPDSKSAEVLAEIRRRYSSPTPLRLCDDEERWSSIWRNLQEVAREAIAEEDCYGDEDLPGFLGWTEQGTPIQEF